MKCVLVWLGICKSILSVINKEVSRFVINKKAYHLAKISIKYVGIYEVRQSVRTSVRHLHS